MMEEGKLAESDRFIYYAPLERRDEVVHSMFNNRDAMLPYVPQLFGMNVRDHTKRRNSQREGMKLKTSFFLDVVAKNANEDGEIVAVAGFREVKSGVAEWGIIVQPQWRGKGAAGEIFLANVETAKSMLGCDIIAATTMAENSVMSKFLKKRGFDTFSTNGEWIRHEAEIGKILERVERKKKNGAKTKELSSGKGKMATVEEALREDFTKVLSSFLSQSNLSYTEFKQHWRAGNLSGLHHIVPPHVDRESFNQLTYAVILRLLHKPRSNRRQRRDHEVGEGEEDSDLDIEEREEEEAGKKGGVVKSKLRLIESVELRRVVWNIAVIYCLYSFHATRVHFPQDKKEMVTYAKVSDYDSITPLIRVSPNAYGSLVIAAIEINDLDDLGYHAVCIFQKMLRSNNFLQCTTTGPKSVWGIQNYIDYQSTGTLYTNMPGESEDEREEEDQEDVPISMTEVLVRHKGFAQEKEAYENKKEVGSLKSYLNVLQFHVTTESVNTSNHNASSSSFSASSITESRDEFKSLISESLKLSEAYAPSRYTHYDDETPADNETSNKRNRSENGGGNAKGGASKTRKVRFNARDGFDTVLGLLPPSEYTSSKHARPLTPSVGPLYSPLATLGDSATRVKDASSEKFRSMKLKVYKDQLDSHTGNDEEEGDAIWSQNAAASSSIGDEILEFMNQQEDKEEDEEEDEEKDEEEEQDEEEDEGASRTKDSLALIEDSD